MTNATVVVPARDRAQLLGQTLAALTAQSPAPRIVVVDDGSQDDTAAVASRHGAHVLRNRSDPWGPARARNEGLQLVATELVSFVDSDDLMVPGGLALLAQALQAAPAAPFAYGRALAMRREAAGWAPHGVIAATERERHGGLGALYARNWIPSSGVLIRTECVRAIGGYDTTMTFSEDHDLWLRLADAGPPAAVDEVVVIYRLHGDNRSDKARRKESNARITSRMEGDRRLRGWRAAREGVVISERALQALRSRQPVEFALAGGDVMANPSRVRTLLAGARHVKERRAAYREGMRLWAGRRDLRNWLERLPEPGTGA
jgi:glycosyltransferase involved in cell wall biosynthesis